MSNGINLTPINPTPMPANLPGNDLAAANTADFGQSLQQAMAGRVAPDAVSNLVQKRVSAEGEGSGDEDATASAGTSASTDPATLAQQAPLLAALALMQAQPQQTGQVLVSAQHPEREEQPVSEVRVEIGASSGGELKGDRLDMIAGRLLVDPAETAVGGKNLPRQSDFSSELAGALTPAQGTASNPLMSQLVPHSSNGLGHAASTSAAVSLPLASSLSDGHAWPKELGHNLIWMANQKQQVAEMQLNPPNLGPLEVRVTIQNDQANLVFVSPHAAVREVIESALPRLSNMFGENGISMGSVLVGDQSMARQQQQQQSPRQRFTRSEEVPDAELGWRRGAFDLNISILA